MGLQKIVQLRTVQISAEHGLTPEAWEMFFPPVIGTTRIELSYTTDYKQLMEIYSEFKNRMKQVNNIREKWKNFSLAGWQQPNFLA